MSFPYINAFQQFFDTSGSPLASGTIEFRNPTSNALIDSFPTADDADAQTNANSNPLTLSASGAATAGLFLEDGVVYKVILKDVNGATVATHDDVRCPSVQPFSTQTTAESAASVTPTDVNYPEGDVRRYGALVDGSTDDIAAWDKADLVSANGGPPIFVPKSSSGMAVASTAKTDIATDVHFEEGAFMLYTGSANEVCLQLGDAITTIGPFGRTYSNLDVRRNSQSDWTNNSSVGIQLLNTANCRATINTIKGFTIGLELMGEDLGSQYNTVILGQSYNNKYQIRLTNKDTAATVGYCNENKIIGGRMYVETGVNTSLGRFGIWLDSTRATKSLPNSNYFLKQSIELNAPDTSGTARAIYVEYGNFNKFENIRDENNDAPFMEVDNTSEWNRATTTTQEDSAVRNDGTFSNNFVLPERRYPWAFQPQSWQSVSLTRASNEYDGSSSVYVPGCSWRNSSNGNQSLASTVNSVDDDYLDYPSTKGIGVMVDTGILKRFVFRKDNEAGRGGRLVVIPYDTNAAQLTTDVSYVAGTGATVLTHTSSIGGAYQTGADSDLDMFFSVTSAVHFIWVGIFGGTASARIRSFGIQSVDGGALSVFQGYTDSNSDPFPNDYLNYATADPANATAGPNYPAGKRLATFNVASGGVPGRVCITQGLGGTAAWENEAALS